MSTGFIIFFIATLAFSIFLLLQKFGHFHVVVKLFFVGIMAPLPAILAEMVTIPLSSFVPAALATPVNAFFGVALVEELVKFASMTLVVPHRHDFNRTVDGAVYGICLALGFAFTENILYIAGSTSVARTLIYRIFTATPLHALTGCLMGTAWARKKLYGRREVGMAVLLAIVLHGIYNWLLT